MSKKFVRILAMILAVILAGSVIVGALASVARAVSQSEIDSLRDKRKAIEQEMQEIESEIDSLKYDQAAAIEQKEILDSQILATQDLIDNIAQQIEVYNGLIAEKEVEVKAAQKKEDDQYQLYKDRVRAMEENGSISYFEIIFGADSFTDLLSRIELISEIMSYDEEVYEDYVVAKQETIAAKESLEEANRLQKQAKAEQEEKEAELQKQVAEADELIKELEGDIDSYKAAYDQRNAEDERIAKEINDMLYELKQQQAAQNKPSNSTGSSSSSGGSSSGDGVNRGSFIWPSNNSHTITSPFGTRLHPIYNTYKTHHGMDIGASYGTDVLASNGGTVTSAQYSSAYGNYVVINHGNGITTLYAHMSKLLVSKGQSVSQGQTIGLVGSTGLSTGPHIHFEVAVNGTRVNPMNYL